jgi:PAS domain S-box-containing protein
MSEKADHLDWRAVFEQTSLAMSVVDVYGRQIAGNAAYAALLGYPVESLALLDIGQVTRPEDRDWTSAYLSQLLSGALDVFETEKDYVRADGATIHCQLRVSPLRDSQGACFALVGVLTPIQHRPRVGDARLRRVLEMSQSTVTIIDRSGVVLETTGRYRAVLGYPVDFWETRSIFDVLVPEDFHRVRNFSEALLASPGSTKEIEVGVRAGNGTISTVLVYAVNLLDDADVSGIILTTVNVTEERRLMAALAERSSSAESLAEAQTSLLATVSHELRNPLHALQGLAELLASEQLHPAATEMAATLARQLNGLAEITQDLLDTARVDSGSVVLSTAPTEIVSLVHEVTEYGRALAKDRPLLVEAKIRPDVPKWVMADPVRLRQILRNLVGNAVKFTSQGSVILELRRGDASNLVFSVTDTGVGIPPDELKRVLDPFTTGSTAGVSRGAGLGLTIVQRFVTAMQGTLQIVSTLGIGSTFRIDVALKSVDAPGPNEDTFSTIGTMVLVVEDNPVNQQLALSQLQRLGMSAVIAGSGEEALEALEAADAPRFDVVMMDYQLPGIDGVETTRRIRTLAPHLASLPVVGLTASASAAHRKAFLDAGMDGFIAKPATLDQIRRAVSDALAVRPRRVATGTFRTLTKSTDPQVSADAVDGIGGRRSTDGEALAGVAGIFTAVDSAVLEHLVLDFGGRDVVHDLVAMFLKELPNDAKPIIDALKAVAPAGSADNQSARRAAHTLKSSARLLGAARLAELCQLVESGERINVDEFRRLVDVSAAELLLWKERV